MIPDALGWIRGRDQASQDTRRKWSVVCTTGVLTGLGHGFVQVAVSAMLKPLAADLGMSRAGVSSAISLARLVQGAMSLVAGHLVDRLGPRRVVASGTAIMALGLILVSMITGPLGLYLAWGLVVAAGTSLAFTVAMDRTVVSVSPSGKGFALAIRFTVVALVTTAQLPIIVWLITTFGWRTACLAWAGVLIVSLPLPLLLFADTNATHAPEHDTAEINLAQAMRTRTYWIVAFAYMAMAGTISGVSLHSIPLLTDRGYSIAAAGGIVATLILMSIPARLLTGLYSDRLPGWALPRLLGAVLFALSLTLFADAIFQSKTSGLILMLSKGIATGAPTVLIVMIVVARFGQASVGRVQGSLMFLQVPGTVAGPILAGLMHDTFGHYGPAMAVFGLLLAASGIALQFAIPRFP